MENVEIKKINLNLAECARANQTVSRSNFSECQSSENSYSINDIIFKCMKIQKLLERSSRTIKRFSREIRSLNKEMDRVFKPKQFEISFQEDKSEQKLYLPDHRKMFDKLLDYSDVSDVEEPEERDTSMNMDKHVIQRHKRVSKKKAQKREKNQINKSPSPSTKNQGEQYATDSL